MTVVFGEECIGGRPSPVSVTRESSAEWLGEIEISRGPSAAFSCSPNTVSSPRNWTFLLGVEMADCSESEITSLSFSGTCTGNDGPLLDDDWGSSPDIASALATVWSPAVEMVSTLAGD